MAGRFPSQGYDLPPFHDFAARAAVAALPTVPFHRGARVIPPQCLLPDPEGAFDGAGRLASARAQASLHPRAEALIALTTRFHAPRPRGGWPGKSVHRHPPAVPRSHSGVDTGRRTALSLRPHVPRRHESPGRRLVPRSLRGRLRRRLHFRRRRRYARTAGGLTSLSMTRPLRCRRRGFFVSPSGFGIAGVVSSKPPHHPAMITNPGSTPERRLPDAGAAAPQPTRTEARGPWPAGAPTPQPRGRDSASRDAITHDFLLANLHPELARDALAAEERRLRAVDL